MQASQDGDVEMVKILCEASTKEEINHQSKVRHINNYTKPNTLLCRARGLPSPLLVEGTMKTLPEYWWSMVQMSTRRKM